MMRTFLRSAPPLMVSYCIILHLSWAYLIYLNPHTALGATGTSALLDVMRSDLIVMVALIISSLQAIVALYVPMPWNVVLLLPQQVLLLISALGAADAIYLSHFADGVERSREFIAADQIHLIYCSVAHALAIIAYGTSTDGR